MGWLVLLVAGPARADSGIAFLELSLMQFILVSVVVVAIETGAFKWKFKQSFGSLVGLVAVVNLVSYLAGLPILWLVSNEGPLYDLINQYRNPLLSLGLMAGAFALTLLVETPLFMLGLKKEKRRVLHACLGANVASYMILTLLSFQFTYLPNNGLRALWQPSSDRAQQTPGAGEPAPVMQPLERP